QVNQPSALCVPQILTPLIGNVWKEGDVTISVNAKIVTAHLQAGALSSTLKGLDANEFPIVEPPDNLTQIATLEFTRDELHEMIARVIPFAATDESRPILTGIHLTADKKGQDSATVKLAAADGFRLAELSQRDILAKFTDAKPPKNWKHALDVIVPARVFVEAEKLAPGDDSEVQTIGITFFVYVAKDQKDKNGETDGSGVAYVDTPQGGMMCQLLAGAYPDVSKIIKTTAELKTIPLPPLQTLNALAGARLFAADSLNTVTLMYTDQRILVKAFSVESGNYARVVRLPLDVYDQVASPKITLPEDGLKMAFNVRYLGEIIRTVAFQDGESPVLMQVSIPSAPMYMNTRNYKTVLMPMNVNDGEDSKVVTQPVSTATPANESSTPEQSAIDARFAPDAATLNDAAMDAERALASVASDPDPANLQDLAAEQMLEQTDPPAEPKIYTVICPCGTQLEIVEGSEEICPNCERIL
ncbi:hypothetical protein ANRL3_02134, partial [Anaerolineae bacterium]